ncbi:MAG: OmpA family protein [Paludibacteraceae bacterium]|nr:OmpA family protein [Paludibacteraceae bacterium]
MLFKKSIVLVAVIALSVSMFADEAEVKGVHPYKVEENATVAPEVAHWSLLPRFGFNAFDGDFNSEMKHNVAIPSVGVSLEYSFTPVWALGLDYAYDMYTVTGKQGAGLDNADTLLCGDMHKVGAYLSVDMINLFFPYAKRKIVSIYLMGGAGAGFYQSRKYYMDDAENDLSHKRGHTASYVNADGVVGPDHMDGYKCLPYLQGGILVDFNLNRSLALGLRADYAYYTKDVIDGRGFSGEAAHASKNNDGIFDMTLSLRYKINAVRKSHPRNMAHDIRMEQLFGGKKDTVYVISHDTVVMQPQTAVASSSNTERSSHTSSVLGQTYYVYFDNARSELTEQGLTIIQQVADRLNSDSTLYVDVIGMCDNTGSDELNNRLATARAETVLDELRNEYDIPADHCLTSGRGKIVGRRSKAKYGPNRRVEIRLISREEYERLKAEREQRGELNGQNVNTDANTSAVRSRESVNAVTLTSLARKYFGNPNCWVYIYEANKDKIDDINVMPVGVDITVPELTEEQKHITQAEALEYYNRIKK